MNIEKIDIESREYPIKLKLLAEPPKTLYCIGNTELLTSSRIMVTVAGTRRASPYGKWVAGELGKVIADKHVIHVGGLSEGIHTAAHKGTLERWGDTIAVLGTGIDVCFPMSNADLYKHIANNGLLVSEYEPGAIASPGNFLARNRIMAALSDRVVIVEGALKSGTAVLASYARMARKDIYAVPGNINQPNAILPNLLIADGATPIACLDEMADTLML